MSGLIALTLGIGGNTLKMLKSDLKLEMAAIPDLMEGIAHCESVKDFVIRDLFSNTLECEEDHVDWLDTQLELSFKVGVETYLQAKMRYRVA